MIHEQAIYAARYVESKSFIEAAARAFAREARFDYDECLSIANALFCDIVDEMPEGRTWLSYLKGCLWNRWVDAKRAACAKYRGCLRDEALALVVTEAHEAIDITEFNDDAWLVACLTINPPDHVQHEASLRGGTPTNFRSCLRKHLAEDLNWDAKRINSAFEEIADRLAGKG